MHFSAMRVNGYLLYEFVPPVIRMIYYLEYKMHVIPHVAASMAELSS